MRLWLLADWKDLGGLEGWDAAGRSPPRELIHFSNSQKFRQPKFTNKKAASRLAPSKHQFASRGALRPSR
jgi:hypothetical protein